MKQQGLGEDIYFIHVYIGMLYIGRNCFEIMVCAGTCQIAKQYLLKYLLGISLKMLLEMAKRRSLRSRGKVQEELIHAGQGQWGQLEPRSWTRC